MRKRFHIEQIAQIVKERKAVTRTGEVCRRHGISQLTFYGLNAKFGEKDERIMEDE